MKNISYLMAMAIMVLSFTACTDDSDDNLETGGDDQKAYTVKQVPVNRNGEPGGTVAIRFYEDMPSVPYISVADFQNVVVPGTTVSVTKQQDNIYLLNNAGSTATVDTKAETIAFDDYMAFTNQMELVQPGMENAYYDDTPFVRFTHQTLVGGSAAKKFDYKKYGIDLRGDAKAVYMPFTTLADLYSDLYNHLAACNGEKVVVAERDGSRGGIDDIDPDFKEQSILARGKRTAALADYSYGELCFVIDHLYGMPGRSPFEKQIQEEGFDAVLESSDIGKRVKELLRSTDINEFTYGMDMLNAYLYDGGHTSMGTLKVAAEGSILLDNDMDLVMYYLDNFYVKLIEKYYLKMMHLEAERKAICGTDTYQKEGNTAVCHFDEFHINIEAWKQYYAGTGPMPTIENTENDYMVIFLDALKRANEDPEVKNLVIDLTDNGGGSSDLVVTMTSLMYGDNFYRCENVLTGQLITWFYDVDRNFDGNFDEKDAEVKYDLNFCILTSKLAFSCGNLLPSLCNDAGLLLLGEHSGGGSCAVAQYRTPEGFRYQISSARGRLINKENQNIDNGIEPQILIPYSPERSYNWGKYTFTYPGYEKFYDIPYLSSVISGN